MGKFSTKNSLNLNELEASFVKTVYMSAIKERIRGCDKLCSKFEKGKPFTEEELLLTIQLIEAYNKGINTYLEGRRAEKGYEQLLELGEGVLEKIKE